MCIFFIAIKLSTYDTCIKLHVSTYDQEITSHRDVYYNNKEGSAWNEDDWAHKLKTLV